MTRDLEALVRLQQLVDRQVALHASLESLPERLRQTEAQLEQQRERQAQSRVRLDETARQRRQLEADLADAESRVQRWKDQLMSVKSNQEYRALNDEIDHERERIGGLEERILLAMEESEGQQAALAAAQQQLVEAERELERQQADNQQQARELSQQSEQLEGEIQRLRGELTEPLLALWARVSRLRGAAVVPIVEEACGACRVRIRPQVLGQIRDGEEIVRCESCGRILYQPEAGGGA